MALTNPTLLSQPAAADLQTVARAVLQVVVFASMFAQPNGLFLYVPIYPQIMLLILIVFSTLWLASKRQTPGVLWPNACLTCLLMLYLALSLVSLAWSPDPVLGARLLSSMCFKVVVFYAIVDLCGRGDTLLWTLKLIAAVSVIFALQGLSLLIAACAFNVAPILDFSSMSHVGGASQNFDLTSYGIFGFVKESIKFRSCYFPRCQSMFLEPGFYSNFLEMTLFVSIACFAIQPPRHKWVPSITYGIQGVALLLTFSPVGLLAAGLGLGVFTLFTYRARARVYVLPFRRTMMMVVVAGAALQGVVPGGMIRIVEVMVISKFVQRDAAKKPSMAERKRLLSQDLKMLLRRPLLGWGTNQARVITGSATNNALIAAAVELGIVGLSLYLALLICVARLFTNTYYLAQNCGSPRHQAFAGATAAAAAAMIFHSLFIETQWTYYYWIALALLCTANRALRSLKMGCDTLAVPSSAKFHVSGL